MSISQLFESLHGMLDQGQLQFAYLLSEDTLSDYQVTLQDIKECAELLGVNEDKIYLDPKGSIYPFCYWDGFLYYPFHALRKKHLTHGDDPRFHDVTRFKYQLNDIQNMLENHQWEDIIHRADKKVSFHVFSNLREHFFPKKQKELFLEIYARNEYGFDKLDKQMVRDVLNMPTPPASDVRLAPGYEPDENDQYVIYRGATSKSSPLEDSYSWTLDKDIAKFFANRFESSGHIYTGIVNRTDIKAYIANRSEHEVLVFPEDVYIDDKERV